MSRTPDWLLERIALGELPPAELERARSRLLSEPGGADRLAALERASREALAAHPPEAVVAEVRRRAHLRAVQERAARGTGPRAPVAVWLGLPLVAALALLVVWTGGDGLPGREVGPQERPALLEDGNGIKGEARLVLFRQGAAEPERLKAGAVARAGDTLQLAYVSGGAAFGAVLSVDGRGAVTLHLPEAGAEAAPLTAGADGAPVALPSSYRLDDAPRFERFFLVTSAKPFPVDVVRRAAEQAATSPDARKVPLALPEGLSQTSFLVEKGTP
jgi:hypothetical protein